MFIAAVVVSIVLAAVLVMSARGKLIRDPQQLKVMEKIGFPADKLWLLATAELAGAAGLLLGLFWWPLGVAAAIGVMAYFIGAVASHLRKRDWNITPPGVLLVAGTAALVLRAVTA